MEDLARRLRELAKNQEEQLRFLNETVKRLESGDEDRARQQALLREKDGRLAALQRENELLRGGAGGFSPEQERRMAEDLTAGERRALERLRALRQELSAKKIPPNQELMEQLTRTEGMARRLMEDAARQVREAFQAERQAQATQTAQPPEAAPAYPQTQPGPAYAPAPPPAPPKAAKPKAGGDSLEMKIGTRIANIVGIGFILLAVVFGLSYTYTYLLQSDAVKGVIAYGFGLLFLGGGEFMNHRQGKSFFSIGLCAGGVAILFATTAACYFTLGILPIPAAVGICVAVTAAALLLSLRYNSQLVAVFALIGGYLPMTALENTALMVFSAMLYFLLLNLFVLLLAVKRQWQPLKLFSICLNAAGVGYLLGVQGFANPGSNASYVLANFLLYVAVVLAFPMLQRTRLRASDTVVLAINTAASCAYIYSLINANGLDAWNGALALAFCLLFFGMGKGLGRFLDQDAGARGLFYATSVAFLVLGIPLQLEPDLISLGWLIEGAALTVFGILAGKRWYRRAGVGISLICLGWFLCWDTLLNLFGQAELYPWKYSAVTLGSVVILGSVIFRFLDRPEFWADRRNALPRVFKYLVLVNVWCYGLYMLGHFMDPSGWHNPLTFWRQVSMCVWTVGLAALLWRIPVLRGKGAENLSAGLYAAGFLMTLSLNAEGIRYYRWEGMESLLWLPYAALVLCSLVCVLALYDGLRLLVRRGVSGRWLPAVLSSLGMIFAMQLLLVQAELGFESMLISFVLMAWAFGMIVYGFLRRITNLRRYGLAVSAFAIAKLAVADLYFLETGQRILSYFVFGLVFLGISFVYQLFSRRLLAPVPAGEAASGAAVSPEGGTAGDPAAGAGESEGKAAPEREHEPGETAPRESVPEEQKPADGDPGASREAED